MRKTAAMLAAVMAVPFMALSGTIGDGIDNPSLTWTTGGIQSVSGENVRWTYNADDSTGDGDCVVSGAGGAGDARSWLKTTVVGPCKVSFYYIFQTYGGSFNFTCDSTALISRTEYTSSNETWRYAEFEIGSGSHELTWEYHHPGTGFVNRLNGVKLDNFVVTSLGDTPESTSGQTWYVNAETGFDSNSGTSESAPKATIQAAIDAASEGDAILVAPGTYSPIFSNNKLLRIESAEGPYVTLIDGNGSICADLCGENQHFSTNTLIVGFTCCNGGQPGSGGGIRCGTAERCIIRDCNGSGSGWGIVRDCLIINNRGINGGGCIGSLVVNCTIVGNKASNSGNGAYCCALQNCILYDNCGGYDNNGAGVFNGVEANDELWKNLGYTEFKSTVYIGDPGFVDAANGDYRLLATSSCIDAGDNLYVTTPTDLAGSARIVNGTVDVGCYEYCFSQVSVDIVDGLVAHYPFDGALNDASGNGHDLVCSGSGLSYVSGHNASYSGAELNGSATLYPSSSFAVHDSFTFSCWYRTSVATPLSDLTSARYSTRNFSVIDWDIINWDTDNFLFYPAQVDSFLPGYVGYGVKVSTAGVNIFEHGNSYRDAVLKYECDLGEGWHHLACTVHDNQPPVLYIDGERVAQGIDGGCQYKCIMLGRDANGYYQIGRSSSGSYRGAMQDMRIYDRALSPAEVNALYHCADSTVVDEVVSVVFDPCYDGLLKSTKTFYANSSYWSLPAVSRTGYSFLGWYTRATGGRQVVAGQAVDPSVTTLYAHWESYEESQRAALDLDGEALLGDNGSTVWTVDSSTCYSGGSSLRSAAIGDSQNTYEALTVTGSGTVTFWWKVSSERNYDYLRYYVDGVEQAAISGAVDWQQKTVTLSDDGTHVIKWQYSKDGSVSSGSDCGWVDCVEINIAGYGLGEYDESLVLAPSVASGTTFYDELNVSFDIGEGSVLYYTLDGTSPSRASDTYSGGFAFVDTTTVRWFVRNEIAGTYGPMSSATYTKVERPTYAVEFDAMGGELDGDSSRVYAEGATIADLPTPVREGYLFTGWFTSQTGGEMVANGLEVTGDMRLYARWQKDGEVVILSAKMRADDPSVMDVVYRVNSVNDTANVRALAFEDGEESFAKVIRPETFIDGTVANIGYMVPANTNLTLSWQATADWGVRLAKVKFMILVEENFYPLPLDLVTIPANGSNRQVTFSTNELTEEAFRDALLWLYADMDRGLEINDGVLSAGGVTLANGSELVHPAAERYVFKSMNYSLLEGENLDYVNETARLSLRPEQSRQYAFRQE